jgi:DNA (cytosine-5)-methyltransferase 1
MNKTFRLGELFCGPGGIGLGATQARVVASDKLVYSIKHAWASDYHEDSCATYVKNLCPADPKSVICADVRTLDISKLSAIDCFAYGFPCNDFSIVGESKGLDGEFGPLYQYGVKVIDRFKPIFFVAENVSGLRSSNGGKAIEQILSALAQSGDGYNLTAHLYRFEDYGVPQTRHRFIIVGMAKKLGLTFKVPAPTHIGRPRTAREALEDPPIPASAANHDIRFPTGDVLERLKLIKPGQNVWQAHLPKHLRLNVKNTTISQIYKRLDPNKPSYTITGSGGGGTHGYHWKEPRALTNRERARIQTFPDNFVFVGKPQSVRRQIGMAVPPEGARIIFSAILKTLAGVKYKSVEANWNRNNRIELLEAANVD